MLARLGKIVRLGRHFSCKAGGVDGRAALEPYMVCDTGAIRVGAWRGECASENVICRVFMALYAGGNSKGEV